MSPGSVVHPPKRMNAPVIEPQLTEVIAGKPRGVSYALDARVSIHRKGEKGTTTLSVIQWPSALMSKHRLRPTLVMTRLMTRQRVHCTLQAVRDAYSRLACAFK